jgi:hypothetical protein
VLIEHADPDAALELASALRAAGSAVAICRGPDSDASPATRCPLHRLESCVVVEGADVVVTALDLERDEARGVLRGLRLRYPATPLLVQATVAGTLAAGEALDGCTVLPVDTAPSRVAAEALALVPQPHAPHASA